MSYVFPSLSKEESASSSSRNSHNDVEEETFSYEIASPIPASPAPSSSPGGELPSGSSTTDSTRRRAANVNDQMNEMFTNFKECTKVFTETMSSAKSYMESIRNDFTRSTELANNIESRN